MADQTRHFVWPSGEVALALGHDAPPSQHIGVTTDQSWYPRNSTCGLTSTAWCSDLDDAEDLELPIKGRAVATVTIVNEKARRLPVPTTALDHLSTYLFSCRVASRAGLENFPAGMIDHEEHIERLEEYRLD